MVGDCGVVVLVGTDSGTEVVKILMVIIMMMMNKITKMQIKTMTMMMVTLKM